MLFFTGEGMLCNKQFGRTGSPNRACRMSTGKGSEKRGSSGLSDATAKRPTFETTQTGKNERIWPNSTPLSDHSVRLYVDFRSRSKRDQTIVIDLADRNASICSASPWSQRRDPSVYFMFVCLSASRV